jgi:hypothetical protein
MSEGRTYPHYSVVRDFHSGCYEVARWASSKEMIIVQAGIRSLDKAWAAVDIWRQREGEKHAQQS